MRTLVKELAHTVTARLNCIKSNNQTWQDNHSQTLLTLVKEFLPSGSGFDRGTKIDLDASTGEKLVLLTAFHHMNESGMYDGWTEHKVIVTPSLTFDFELRITGRNRNGIKEMIADYFRGDLSAVVNWNGSQYVKAA